MRNLTLEGIVEAVRQFYLKAEVDPAHKWEHIERVIKSSIVVLSEELNSAECRLSMSDSIRKLDPKFKWVENFITLVALMHDINDHKAIGNIAYLRQRSRLMVCIDGTLAIFLKGYGLHPRNPETFIYKITDQISWSKNKIKSPVLNMTKMPTAKDIISVAIYCVRDADRLESTGVIGLTRAVSYAIHNHGSTYSGLDHFFKKQDEFKAEFPETAFHTNFARQIFEDRLLWTDVTKEVLSWEK